MEENIIINSQANDNTKVKPKIINKASTGDVCGAAITWFNRARHLKTKKHNDAICVNHDKFEIK